MKLKSGDRVIAIYSDDPFFNKWDHGTVCCEAEFGWWVRFDEPYKGTDWSIEEEGIIPEEILYRKFQEDA